MVLNLFAFLNTCILKPFDSLRFSVKAELSVKVASKTVHSACIPTKLATVAMDDVCASQVTPDSSANRYFGLFLFPSLLIHCSFVSRRARTTHMDTTVNLSALAAAWAESVTM